MVLTTGTEAAELPGFPAGNSLLPRGETPSAEFPEVPKERLTTWCKGRRPAPWPDHGSPPWFPTNKQCGLGRQCWLPIQKLRSLRRTVSKAPSSSQIPRFHDLTHRIAVLSQADSEICSSLGFHNLNWKSFLELTWKLRELKSLT